MRMLAAGLLVCAATAQLPQVGDINVYGLHKLTAGQILRAAHLEKGERIPGSRGDLEGRIASLPGIAAVQVQTDCCDGNRADLFIGIEEEGTPGPTFLPAPTGTATLPATLLKTYRDFRGAALRAGLRGSGDEILSAGHPLSVDPTVREFQSHFLIYARTHFETLSRALRNSADAEHRQAAATVIAYSPRKTLAAADLLGALQDPDEGVRAYAAHALSAIATLGQKQPALGIRIPAKPFVALLHSVVLTDRVESIKTLLVLTGKSNVAALDLIRAQALPDLAEMARWKTVSYAKPAFLLLGRVAGLPDEQVRQSWEKGDRDPVIQKALESGRKSGA